MNEMHNSKALDLAKDIADITVRNTFRAGHSDAAIRDVLLFGSTIAGKTAHDVDLLLLHDHPPMNEFGFATIYQGLQGMQPDPNGRLEHGFYSAKTILSATGGQIFPTAGVITDEVDRFFIRHLRHKKMYQGTLHGVPFLGNIEFPEQVSVEDVRERIESEIDSQCKQQLVVTQVVKLMEALHLDIEEVLDLHAMNIRLLDPLRMHDERRIAIKQSRDPEYWWDVLKSGKLYDRNSGRFDLEVDEKYPDATKLFEAKV